MISNNVAIFDNAFDPDVCSAAAKTWPAPEWEGWHAVYKSEEQRKRACNAWPCMSAFSQVLLRAMLALDVRRLGFGRLIPDTSLWGGGMHDMGAGDRLGLHLDADTHVLSGMRRVLNAILFLTPEWQAEWGGELEIWDGQRERRTLAISPVFNRLVLFATSDASWHGVPQPLRCPPDVRRKTLTVWWYAPERGDRRRLHAHFAETEAA